MGTNRTWLAAMATALGVSESACHRATGDDVAAARDVSVASASASASSVPDIAPSASVAVVESASASATPSATASAAIKKTLGDLGITPQSCGGSAAPHNASCGQVSQISALCGVGTSAPNSNSNSNSTTQQLTANIATSFVGASAADDMRAVARLRPRLRACGTHALQVNPSEQGRLVVAIGIDAKGEVTSVSIASNANLGSTNASCMVNAFHNATFTPTGAARTLQVAIVQTRSDS